VANTIYAPHSSLSDYCKHFVAIVYDCSKQIVTYRLLKFTDFESLPVVRAKAAVGRKVALTTWTGRYGL